jgi:hypothetical protein
VIYDTTLFGLLYDKISNVDTLPALILWGDKLLQNNPDLPANLKNIISEFEVLYNNKEQFTDYPFPRATSDLGEYLYMRDDLRKKVIVFCPRDTDQALRDEYANQFFAIIPSFQQDWQDDVEFRGGNNSLSALFVFVSHIVNTCRDRNIRAIFNIIDTGLSDSRELIQFTITCDFLKSIMLSNSDYRKYMKYMPENTMRFCKLIQAFYNGEKL